VGPLLRTYNENRFTVVATDHTTRWCEAKALKSKSTNLVAEFMIKHILLNHGTPVELLSDQGCEFIS
jgi:hypothetical protein